MDFIANEKRVLMDEHIREILNGIEKFHESSRDVMQYQDSFNHEYKKKLQHLRKLLIDVEAMLLKLVR